MSTTGNPDADVAAWFLHRSLSAASALAAAGRLGVLTRLEEGPASAEELARDCNLDEYGAGLLLRVLATLGLARRGADSRFEPVLADLPGLRRWKAASQALAGALRRTPVDAVGYAADFVALLKSGADAGLARAWEYLAPLPARVLVLSGGASRATLAPLHDPSESRLRTIELAPGKEPLPVDLGIGHDLALVQDVCHSFDKETNARLFRRLSGTCALGGGRVAIIEGVPNESLEGPLEVLLYGLGLLLRERSSRLYPFSTYVGWLRTAGYQGVQRHELSPSPLTLITAEKPPGGT